MSSRLVALILLVVVSAVGVAASRHEARKRFVELQKLEAARDAMNVEWGQLLLEEGAWSAHGRIEKLAREKLNMHSPSPEEVVIVKRGP